MSHIVVDKPGRYRIPFESANKNLIRVLAQHKDAHIKGIQIDTYATELIVRAPKEFIQMAQVCAQSEAT